MRGYMRIDPEDKIRKLREQIDRLLGPTEAARIAKEAVDEGIVDAEAGLPQRE